MKIKRTVKTPGGRIAGNIEIFDIDHFDHDDQVRVGFVKGTLKKATFELHSGSDIIYELVEP